GALALITARSAERLPGLAGSGKTRAVLARYRQQPRRQRLSRLAPRRCVLPRIAGEGGHTGEAAPRAGDQRTWLRRALLSRSALGPGTCGSPAVRQSARAHRRSRTAAGERSRYPLSDNSKKLEDHEGKLKDLQLDRELTLQASLFDNSKKRCYQQGQPQQPATGLPATTRRGFSGAFLTVIRSGE